MQNESPADGVGGSGGEHRYHKTRRDRSNEWHGLEHTGGADATGGGDHRSRLARYQCFAPIFGECYAVDLRKTTKHQDLETADSKCVDYGHGYNSGNPGPDGEPV